MKQLSVEQIVQISGLVTQYITTQRERALPHAQPLNAAQRATMDRYFIGELLDTVRVSVLSQVHIENPPFYSMLAGIGLTNLPDFSTMAAITFSDVIVSRQQFTLGLLFHELVHVEQYRQLGIAKFSELYVRGFLTGGGYDGIPLEVNAYSLGARFEANPLQRFSVADEVTDWNRANRF